MRIESSLNKHPRLISMAQLEWDPRQNSFDFLKRSSLIQMYNFHVLRHKSMETIDKLLDQNSIVVWLSQKFPDDNLKSYHLPGSPSSAESVRRLCMRRKPQPKGNAKSDSWASAKGWLRRRREKVRAAMKNDSIPENSDVKKVAKRLWSQGHQKEQNHHKDRERKRRNLALLSTVLSCWPH